MKIVVVGGTGLIGSKVVAWLGEQGHEAVAAAPSRGVNTLTGEGLAEALAGASVAVDVANSPSFDPAAVLEFFETSTRNLLAAEEAAGVGHHVALSIVGIDRTPDNGYFQAKIAQEALIEKSSIPFTIVRATQFFEFTRGIADASTEAGTVRLPHAFYQPIAAEEVSAAVARAAVAAPVNGRVEVAGPEAVRMDEFVRTALAGWNDPRQVVGDPHGTYFGSEVGERALLPGAGATIGRISFRDWLDRTAAR
ncbi:SDR family oxidoreductase [Dactylosporangium roseum]|uniref:SDR family oxidoreductase n=1 Tax=Dactylosporangium roseum TaxID=47989 RepID=A0ABY5YYJ0_9ACTN|nr:SDR family oxidoreductase [Dactylosporangium roseum]UWZ33928.1 SDR family oxidoreductase [Dactylosporangium roseum]